MTDTTGGGPDTEHAPELEATDARQGRWGRHMLWVLLAGLLLVVITLFGTWASRAPDLMSVDDRARATAEEGPPSPSQLAPVKNRATEPPAEQAPAP